MITSIKSNQPSKRYKPILMDCRTVQEKILQFLYNELDPEELSEIAQHLNECNICSREQKIIADLLDQLKSWEQEEPDQTTKNRIHDNILKKLK